MLKLQHFLTLLPQRLKRKCSERSWTFKETESRRLARQLKADSWFRDGDDYQEKSVKDQEKIDRFNFDVQQIKLNQLKRNQN